MLMYRDCSINTKLTSINQHVKLLAYNNTEHTLFFKDVNAGTFSIKLLQLMDWKGIARHTTLRI